MSSRLAQVGYFVGLIMKSRRTCCLAPPLEVLHWSTLELEPFQEEAGEWEWSQYHCHILSGYRTRRGSMCLPTYSWFFCYCAYLILPNITDCFFHPLPQAPWRLALLYLILYEHQEYNQQSLSGHQSLSCLVFAWLGLAWLEIGLPYFLSCWESLMHNWRLSVQFSRSVMSDSASPWTTARQASLSITNSCSLLKLMSIESVMPSNHLIPCRPLLLLPSIFPSIRVFSSE